MHLKSAVTEETVFGAFVDGRTSPLLARGEREKTAVSSLPQKPGGFTLIEIMVVVIVIGILAATIIPQFMGTTHDAKVSSAKANIAELESALERFNVHM